MQISFAPSAPTSPLFSFNMFAFVLLLLLSAANLSLQICDGCNGYVPIDHEKSLKLRISSPYENLVFRNAKMQGGLWMDWAEYESVRLEGQGFGSENSFEFSVVPAGRPMNASFEVHSEERQARVLSGRYTVSKAGAVNFRLESHDDKIKCSREVRLKNMWHYLVEKEQREKDVRRVYITCQ